MSNTLSAPEETLVYLNHSPDGQLTQEELKKYVRANPKTVSIAISRLVESRYIRISSTGEVVITPRGQKRVSEEIMPCILSDTAKN